METNAIKIWNYNDAPQDYQGYHGGDEDYVIFVPDGMNILPCIAQWMEGYGGMSQRVVNGGIAYTLAHS